MTPAQLTRFAAEEYLRRQTKAREAVKARRHTLAQAEDLMRPWAAIALLLGVDPAAVAPDCAEALETRRACRRFPGNVPALYDEPTARALLARDLCSPLRWGPVLATARDRQLDKAWAERCARPDRDEGPECARAGGLFAMCQALDVFIAYRPKGGTTPSDSHPTGGMERSDISPVGTPRPQADGIKEAA